MTPLRMGILKEPYTALRECSRRIQIGTFDMEPMLTGAVQVFALRWTPNGRADDLVTEGDRQIRLQLCMFGLETGGDRS